MHGRFFDVLKSMYESVSCCVKCADGITDFFECTTGLKQGCKISPLLFSLLMTSLTSEIRCKGRHGVQLLVNDTELFVLVFADDIVLVSHSVPGLQNQINNLKVAAERLGLKTNTQKTKIMVHRLGGHIANHEKWILGNQLLEVVTKYTYLGLYFSTKLSSNVMLSDLATRAKIALSRVQRSLRKLVYVTPDVFFKVFDAQIQPILLYGSEIWGLDTCHLIEIVHLSALKQYLNVSQRTPNAMVYGDTGRYPLHVNAALRGIKYWLRILNMDEYRYPHKVYQMMLRTVDINRSWVSKIKTMLVGCGFENEWKNQIVKNGRSFVRLFRERMIGKFRNEWEEDINVRSRFAMYRHVKHTHELESYLYCLDKKIFRDIWIRFRFGISDLFNHKYRYRSEISSTLSNV